MDEAMIEQTPTEEWQPHPVCSTYWFSSLGGIERRIGGKVRSLSATTAGQQKYKAIDMHTEDKRRVRRYVHRVVCELFNGPPEKGMECRHLNGDKHDNRAANLRWGTARENMEDKRAHGRMTNGERNGMAKLTALEVAQMRYERAANQTPFYKIAKNFNVSTMTAYRAVVEQSWK
jgi:hypothetical protein